MAQKLPEDLLRLIAYLKRLSGVGSRTAERFAFELLGWEHSALQGFGETLAHLKEKVPACSICGCLSDQGICRFCNKNKDRNQLCLIASAKDAYAIEETGQYRGLFHVIEHLLSPLDGRHAKTINIEKIIQRIEENGVREVIIAFDSTLEGDTTALYLKGQLSRPDISISRLAFGIPVGSSLESIDGGTLARAFSGRQSLN